ncbi:MAG: hypothetical protein CFE21_04425 [Bacteroidetes bacterium B1(2017)]|nr:MAG: hypothetical protein CFE21_04425 [Bacteroidetes bacterium B1(2017)]
MKTKLLYLSKGLVGTILFLLIGTFQLGAQALSGTYSIPGNYASIEAAIAALNTNGVSGAVTFNIGAGSSYTEFPTSTLVLGSATLNATTSNTNTITFQKAATATANPLITAYAGTKLATSADSIDGIWAIAGTDFVTINGIDLLDPTSNTTPTTCMEFGYGLYKLNVNDGVNNTTIRNCVITLNRLNVTAPPAGARSNIGGSTGIDMINATRQVVNTALVQTAVSGANSNNKFYSNTIQNCNFGIALAGATVASPYTLADFNNDIGGNSYLTGNNIINFGGGVGATIQCGATYISNQYNANISYNNINNNDGSGVNHPVTNRGIWLFGNSPGASINVNYNTITIKSGAATGSINWCIDMEMAQTGANGNTININNNQLLNCTSATGSTVAFTGIWANSAPTTMNINNNYFYGFTYNGTAASQVACILNQLAGVGTLNINNNSIDSTTLLGASGAFYNIVSTAATLTATNINGNTITRTTLNSIGAGSQTMYPIFNSGTTPVVNIIGNTINNLTRNGTTGGTTIGIYPSSGTIQNVRKNTVSNMSINGTGATSTMYGIQTSLGVLNIDSNIVFNLSVNKVSGTGALYGIYNISSPTNETFSNNQIYNLTHLGTGLVYGIYAFTTTGVRTVRDNTIYNLTGNGGNVVGLLMLSSSPTITRNKIYSLRSNGATTGTVFGISLTSLGTSGIATISNNLIDSLIAPNYSGTTDAIRGISSTITTATTSLRIYYNTIRLGATTGGANFSSSGIFFTGGTVATTATLDLRNNIIVNNSTPIGTGLSVALRNSTTTFSNYASTSNNNLFYAGTPGVANLIYYDGVNSDQTIAAFKSRLVSFEQASFTENPTFISSIGSSPDFLHLDLSTPTRCESGAANIAGITTDFDNAVRQGNAGYLGSGAAPDVGADEGNFPGISMVLDSIMVDQITAAVPINSTNQQIVAIRVHTSNSFAPFTLSSLKLNTSGTTSVNDIQNAKVYFTGNSAAFNTSTQFGSTVVAPNGTFYINGTRTLASGANYFWVTYDTKATATANNFIDVRVDSLVIGGTNMAPANGDPIGSRKILAPLNGTYNVGLGQTYPSITAANADLGALGVSGPVTFVLKDVMYNAASGEVFPIVMNAYAGSSATNTVSIRPDAGVYSTIEGNNAGAALDLNGINNFILDGRPGATGGFVSGNNLIVSNTNGIGMAIRFNNEASANRILYCDLRSNNTTAPGTINAGVVNFGASSGLNGNDNNTIKFCDIHELTGGNPTIAISSIGSAVSVAANNDGNLVDSCNIYNFFNPSIATAAIYVGANNSTWTINANKFYQTATITTTGTQTHRILWVTPNVTSLTSASGFNITNNVIGYTSANGTGTYTMAGTSSYQFYAMDISVGLGAATSVQNNTITNFSFTSGFSGNGTYGINVANGNVNVGTVTGNLFGSTTTNGAFTFTTTTTNGGLIAFRSGAGGTINFSNNIASGIDLISNSTTLYTSFNGIAGSGGANLIINNNTIGSPSLANSINVVSTSATATAASPTRGIICNSGTAGVINTITNNTIANINSNYAATGTQATSLVGIAVTTGTSIITGNTIKNLTTATQTTAGGSTSAIVGIAYTSTTAPTTITNNSISALVLTGTSTTAAVQAEAMFYSGPTTGTNIVSRNLVHSMSMNASNPNVYLTGFDVANGIGNFQNNMIRLGYDSIGVDVLSPAIFRGISKNSGSFNFYNNSVFIGGNGITTGASNTFAFQRTGTGVDIVRNNVFVNNRSNSGATGKHYQVFLLNNTTITQNNNVYYGNGTGAVFATLNNGASDVISYSSGWLASDLNSVYANPQFINATGSASTGDLHISTTLATPVEASGAVIAAVTDDYDGQARSGLTPTDIGADAGNFVPLDLFAPVFGNFTVSNTSSTGDRIFTVNITDLTGVPLASGSEPRVYFKKFATGTWSSTAATRTSGNAQNGTYNFTISQSALGGLSLNDSVYFFLIAQDSAAATNIASFPGGASASNVGTITNPPASFLSYKIVGGISGSINVGIGQTYTSLTGVGGLFEAINNGSITSNITAVITSDLTEDGTNGLNQINETGLGNYTVSIVPDGTTERLIAGSFAGGLIRFNGADRVKIDGRFAGSGRYLRIRNRVLGGYTINMQNDALRDTVTYCHIESVNNTVGTVTFLGTTGTIGNDSNAITYCIIRDTLGTISTSNIPNTGFFSQGTAGIGNDYNTFANNEIANFGFNGMNLSTTAGDFWNIANNSFYQTIAKANAMNILQIDGGNGLTITGNSIGGSNAVRGGTAFTTTSTTTPNIVGLRINNAVTTANISNNTFSNIASIQAVNLISISAGTATINNNTFGGAAQAYDTIQNGFDNGIITVTGGTVTITNNLIGNVNYYDNAGDRTSGITISGGTVVAAGNTIRDLRSNSSGTAFTFLVNGIQISGGTNHNIENNTIYNIVNTNTGASAYTATGITLNSGTNVTIQRNRIYNIWGLGTGTGASSNQVFGIYNANTLNSTILNNQISIGNNTIGETRVYGIQDVSGSGNDLVYNNTIFVTGTTLGGSNNSYCLQRTGLGAISSFNNIFYNKRTSTGTGFNYATGTNSLTGIAPSTTNYNLYVVNDTTKVAESPLGVANSASIFNTLYTSVNTYSSNWYALSSAVPAQTMFTDTLTGNLGIVSTNANAWYANGKGLPLAAVSNDYNNSARSTTIAGGATDLGSTNFIPTSTPPAATASAAPAPNTTTTYTFAGRMVASINWGTTGTVPTSVSVVYYTGTNAPNLLASKTQYNAYYAITAIGGAGYTYGISLISDSATFGNVAGTNASKIARYTGTTWNLISNSSATAFNGNMLTTGNNQTVFGNFAGTDFLNNPLPVEMLNFNASLLNSDVLLNWATSSEKNNKGFEVEKSSDGVSFTNIGFVKGASNSSTTQTYKHLDANAFENAPSTALYYRLKQVDQDGKYTYSKVAIVSKDVKESKQVVVFPNPFTTHFDLVLTGAKNETITIETSNIEGKQVNSQVKTLNETGVNVLSTQNLESLPAGIYFVRVTHLDTIQVFKLVKN